jgi:hypothetical protein
MRIAVGLLACLAAGAMTAALADPPSQTAPAAAAPAAPATPAPAATTSAPATSATAAAPAAPAAPKPELDKDTQHFLAEGFKPEMHGGEQVYCRKDTALGSRLAPVKNCGTIEQLKLNEQRSSSGVRDSQRQQVGLSGH